jgi:hypothetical protein
MPDPEELSAYFLPLPVEVTRGRAIGRVPGCKSEKGGKRSARGSAAYKDLVSGAAAFYHTPGHGLPTRNAGLAPLRGVYFCTRPVLTSAV